MKKCKGLSVIEINPGKIDKFKYFKLRCTKENGKEWTKIEINIGNDEILR